MNQLHKKMIIINIIEKGGIKQWETPIDSIQDQIKGSIAKIEYPGIKRIYFFKGDENEQEYIDYLKEIQPSLDDAKQQMCIKLDSGTQDAIFTGITYKGKILSMSIGAQTTYLGLLSIPLNKFPLPFITKDDKDYVLVQDITEAQDLYFLAWNKIADSKKLGGQLKLQVNSLQTIEEVLNFKDPR